MTDRCTYRIGSVRCGGSSHGTLFCRRHHEREERLAIMEFDGGMTRAEAERAAR